MRRTPKGCTSFGGNMAAKLEYCRNKALKLFAMYGYKPFSPAEFQWLGDAWEALSPSTVERLITFTSPYGEPCVLRADLTLSAVTYLASRFSDEERPLRLSYAERVFAVPKAPKQNIERNQIGVELIGWEGAGADVEIISLLFRTLETLKIDATVAIGDMSVMSKIFAGIDAQAAKILTDNLQNCDYVSYENNLAAVDLAPQTKKFLYALPSLKGSADVIEEAEKLSNDTELFKPLKKLCKSLSELGYGDKIRVDLGFLRELGYYSGPVFNAYTKDGVLLGGGGRYDGLLARLGMDGEAAGFALNLKELADSCSGSMPQPMLMLWGGACESSEVLKFTEFLRDKDVSFELSWNSNREESLRTAGLRNYNLWADFSEKEIYNLKNNEVSTFEEYDWGCF